MHMKLPGGWGARSDLFRWLRQQWNVRLTAVTMTLLVGVPALAQDKWPSFPVTGNHAITRGEGFYFSPLKLGILWLIFLLWVKCVDWTSRDCQQYKFEYATWIPIVAGPFLAGLLLAFFIPWFWLGAPIALLTVLVPLFLYVRMRNEEVEPHEQVGTKSHLRFLMSEMVNKMGGKMSAEAKQAHEKGAAVEFMVFGGDKNQDGQANLVRARQNPGFVPCKQVIADAVDSRAEKVMLDCSAMSVSARHQIDGVWHDADGMEREEGDEMITALKLLANMNPAERKERQKGQVGAKFSGQKYFCSVVSQGTKSGERVILSLSSNKNEFAKLDDLGMREPVIKDLKEKMLQPGGILLFSAIPAGGLSTTFSAAINSTDRIMRDFVSIEIPSHRMDEIENCDPVIIEGEETIADKLPGILRKDADVLVIPKLTDQESVTALCKAAKERLVFMQIPSKDAVEAMLRVLMLKVPIKDFASVISVVVNQRLVRKLCDECKEGYKPPASLLQKLRLPANRIDEFFKPPTGVEEKDICEACNGIGYIGRTAIFEVVEVKENLRKTLLTQPKLEILRKASRKDGNRSLQEEGILAVVRGVTSLPEIQRVLKQ